LISIRYLLGLAIALTLSTAARADFMIENAGFEAPDLSGVYAYRISVAQQSDSGWTFSGDSGIAASLSEFDVVNAPDGNQVASDPLSNLVEEI